MFQSGANGSRLLVRGTDIDPTRAQQQFLLRGSLEVRRLVHEAGARLRSLPDGAELEVGSVRLKIQNWEELFIAAEVFAAGIYNLSIRGEFALIDVGMNVGTTALFFARQAACVAVYGFEPFPKTLEKAQVNFSLNPEFARKINVTPSGLAARSFSTELDYFEDYKGSVGMNGLPSYVTDDPNLLRKEKVRVNFLSASEAVTQIAAKHPQLNLVCKLDCEGAEYEIIESLARNRTLSKLSCLMIEWHQRGGQAIEESLVEHGFNLLSFSPNSPEHSMIYGWNPAVAALHSPGPVP